MGNYYGTVALLAAVAVFALGVKIWERVEKIRNPSPPLLEPVEGGFARSDMPEVPVWEDERGGVAEVETRAGGVTGVWIRHDRGAGGDDDDA